VESAILGFFLEALRQIFSETGISVEIIGSPDNDASLDQVVTSVGIAGKVKGNFMLCADYGSARSIVACMTGGISIPAPLHGLGELQKTALGELANQIAGRAVTLLSEQRLDCTIAPPIIITAEKLTSHLPNLMESFSRIVKGSFGSLHLMLAVSST
jgi:CheY-specific phosphatase CheX